MGSQLRNHVFEHLFFQEYDARAVHGIHYIQTIAWLQRQRDNIELVDDEYFGTVFHLLNLAKSAPKLFQKANIEQKRSLLQIVLSNFSLDGDQLRWKLKEPFETMVLCSENSSWLRVLDDVRIAIAKDPIFPTRICQLKFASDEKTTRSEHS